MQTYLNLFDPQFVRILKQGAVCIIPTDTVYGLVCLASLPKSVKRLYSLKQRDNKPGTIIAASVQQLIDLGVSKRSLRSVEHLWPNPLSVVVPDDGTLDYLDGGLRSLAVRIPSDDNLRKLLQEIGPLLTTSANHPGENTAEDVDTAIGYFHDSVDAYVDGGNLSGKPPSTVIRIVDDAVEVLRQGAVHINEHGHITS